MLKLISSFFVVLLFVLFNAENSEAQGICVLSEISTNEIRGFVLLPNNIPISGASIQVLKSNKKKSLIKSVFSDDRGFFQVSGLRNGKYYVDVSYPSLVTMHFLFRLNTSNNKKKDLYLILNGLIGEPCGGGDMYEKDVETK